MSDTETSIFSDASSTDVDSIVSDDSIRLHRQGGHSDLGSTTLISYKIPLFNAKIYFKRTVIQENN